MILKGKVIELLQLTSDEMEKFISSLSDAERVQTGAPDDWSVKDNIAHIHAWNVVLAGRLAGKTQEELPPVFSDFDETNLWLYEQNKDLPWEQLISELEESQRELLVQVGAQEEEALTSTDRYEWQRERPLWHAILSTTLDHVSLHLAELYNERGDKQGGLRIIQTATDAMMPLLSNMPDAQGVYLYNLGCYFALAGDKEKAISHVRQALPLRPSLLEWSKEDSDLDSLREEPEFQALYSDE